MKRFFFLLSIFILFVWALAAPLEALAQITRTFDYFADEFEDGQTVSLTLNFYKKYAGDTGWKRSIIGAAKSPAGERYFQFAYMPQYVTIKDGKYTVEIPKKYYNKNYFLEILFDNGLVSPRINLSPISDYTPKNIYIIFGALFISVFAWARFNTWTDKNAGKFSYSPRNFTTWIRFTRSAFLYTLITEAFFLLIVISPGTLVYINKLIGKSALEYSTLMEMGQYSVLWSIFIITGILPNFPWINKLEMRFREIMHDFAFIPAESRAVISQLEINYTAFKPDDKIIARVLEDIDTTSFSEENFHDIGNSIPHKWCKLSYLKFRLMEWKTFPKINQFFGLALEKFGEFVKQYDSLKPEIENYIKYLKSSSHDQASDSDGFLSSLEHRIADELDRLLTKAFSLISIGALATERLPHGRRKAFKYFGLEPYLPEQAFVDWDTNLKSTVAIIVSAGVPTVFYYYYFLLKGIETSDLPPFVPSSSTQALLWTLACVLTHGMTIFLVVFYNAWRKRVDSSEYNEEISALPDEKNKIVRISFACMIGYLISFLALVSLFVLPKITELAGDQLLYVAKSIALWPIIAAITGGFVQYYLEYSLQEEKKAYKESLIQGSITALIASIISLIFLDQKWIETWYFIFFVAANSFLIGSSIGYIFPTGYRCRYKKMSVETDRRIFGRKKIFEPVTVQVDNAKYACNMLDFSLGGAKLDRIVRCPIGSSALIKIKSVGDLNAIIVRKAKKNTYIHFPYLDRNIREDLEYFFRERNLINHAEAEASRKDAQFLQKGSQYSAAGK